MGFYPEMNCYSHFRNPFSCYQIQQKQIQAPEETKPSLTFSRYPIHFPLLSLAKQRKTPTPLFLSRFPFSLPSVLFFIFCFCFLFVNFCQPLSLQLPNYLSPLLFFNLLSLTKSDFSFLAKKQTLLFFSRVELPALPTACNVPFYRVKWAEIELLWGELEGAKAW